MPKASRLIQFACLFLGLVLGAPAQEPATAPAADDRPEKIYTEEIYLNASAYDLNGRFVSDVRREDVVILENGRLQQANSVRRIPASVLLMLDTGGAMSYAKSAHVTRTAAKNLVGALRPDDRFALMQYHEKVETLADWTGDKAEIFDALEKNLGFGRRSVFFEALAAAVPAFDRTPRGNRHLVLITDGIDSFDDPAARERAIKALIASDINVHVISYTYLQQAVIEPKKRSLQKGEAAPKRLPEAGLLGLPDPKRPGEKPSGPTPRELAKAPRLGSLSLDREMKRRRQDDYQKLETAEQDLKTIVEDTNGEFFLPENYDEMMAKPVFLAQTIDLQYIIAYTPKFEIGESAEGEIRRIEVSSKRGGLRLEGRRKLVLAKTRSEKK